MKRMYEVMGLYVLVLIFVPFVMGSSCRFNSAMDGIRSTHSGIREGFQHADEVLAPMLTTASDLCMAEADEQELSGREGMNYYHQCIESWFRVEEAFSVIREALAELEAIYDDIENGHERTLNLQRIATRLVTHARNVIRLLTELEVEIPSDLTQAIDGLCQLTSCEE